MLCEAVLSVIDVIGEVGMAFAMMFKK